MEIWTVGGAWVELEGLNLRLKICLTVLCVPNFIFFAQAVLWAAMDLREIKKKTNWYNKHRIDIFQPSCVGSLKDEMVIHEVSHFNGCGFLHYEIYCFLHFFCIETSRHSSASDAFHTQIHCLQCSISEEVNNNKRKEEVSPAVLWLHFTFVVMYILPSAFCNILLLSTAFTSKQTFLYVCSAESISWLK